MAHIDKDLRATHLAEKALKFITLGKAEVVLPIITKSYYSLSQLE